MGTSPSAMDLLRSERPAFELLHGQDFASFESDWRVLETHCPARTVFASAEFIALWYRHYAGVFGTPRVMLIRDQNGVPRVGVAWIARRTRFGGIPVRRLDLAGYDGASGELLVSEGKESTQAVRHLVRGLSECDDWDLACIENIAPVSPWNEAISLAAQEAGLVAQQLSSAYAYVDLRTGPTAHWAVLDGKRRRNLKRALVRGSAAGLMAVEGVRFFDPGTWPQCEDALARAFALIEANPKMRAVARGMSDYHRRFYRALAEHYVPRGQFDLAILTIGGADAAFVMALVEHGIYYDVTVSYAEAFKPAFPGINLMHRLIESLPAFGVHTVISHGAYDYKRSWATGFRSVLSLEWLRPNWRTRLGTIGRRIRAYWPRRGAQGSDDHD